MKIFKDKDGRIYIVTGKDEIIAKDDEQNIQNCLGIRWLRFCYHCAVENILIGETLYFRAYLIQFNTTKGATANISRLALSDEEFQEIFVDSKNGKRIFIGDNMVVLDCIGSAYTTVINEDVIELAKENAIEWYNKQIDYCNQALAKHTLAIKNVKKVNIKNLQFSN